MTEPICTIRDMKKSFILEGKEIHVLQGVNLTIHAGDMCAVQGKSGVGKSTLLHIMGGLDRPTSGSVQYFGKDVFNLPEPELARFRNRSIGFVFQFVARLATNSSETTDDISLRSVR